MRAHPRLTLAIAVGFATCATLAMSEQVTSGPTPEFVVNVSVAPTSLSSVELLGRPTSRTFSCSASVLEAGTKRVYMPPVVLTVAPGTSEHISRESDGFTFQFTAKIPRAAVQAETELLINEGSRVVSRYRSVTVFPERAPPQ